MVSNRFKYMIISCLSYFKRVKDLHIKVLLIKRDCNYLQNK